MIITLDIPDSAWELFAPSLSKFATSDSRAAIDEKDAKRRHISEVRSLAGRKGVRAKRIKRGLPVPDEQLIPFTFEEPVQPEPVQLLQSETEVIIPEPEPTPEPTPEPEPAPISVAPNLEQPEPELFPVEEVTIPEPSGVPTPPDSPPPPKRPKKPKNNPELYKPDEYPWVQSMDIPLTVQQYNNACEKYGQSMIDKTLEAMENYKPLHQKSRSASRTLLRWCYEELERQKKQQFNNRNGTTYRPSDLRSQQLQRDWELAQHQAAMFNGTDSSDPNADLPI